MSVCVNINSKEFKDTSKRLNISSNSLENIVHEYINTEGNENSFPSDSYILERVEGKAVPFMEFQLKLWEKRYSQPIEVNAIEEATKIKSSLSQLFPIESIGIKETLDNKYQVTVKKGTIEGANTVNYNLGANVMVLSKSASSTLDAVKTRTGGFPNTITDKFFKVKYIKINSRKNSRRYRAIDLESGQVINQEISLYTQEEAELIKLRKKKLQEGLNEEYNKGRSVGFKAQLEKPGKSTFRRAAKQYLYEALRLISPDIKSPYIDSKIIDKFIDSIDDSIWEHIFTYTLSPTFHYGKKAVSDNVLGTTTNAPREFFLKDYNFNEGIPKQGLLLELEKVLNIKLIGQKYTGYTKKLGYVENLIINNKLEFDVLLDVLNNFYNKRYKPSVDDSIKLYAKTHGYTIEEVNNLLRTYIEEDTIESTYKAEEIRSYTPLIDSINSIKEDYIKSLQSYFKEKGITAPTENLASIIFNRDSYIPTLDTTATILGRLATIFHEPYHAIKFILDGTTELQEVYDSLSSLLKTRYGKELFDEYKSHNSSNGYNNDQLEEEFLADIFSLMFLPKNLRDLYKDSGAGTLAVALINKLDDILSKPDTIKYFHGDTTIIETFTEEEQTLLPFLKRVWNAVVRFISQCNKVIDTLNLLFKETNLIENYKEHTIPGKIEERQNYELKVFKDTYADLINALQVLTQSTPINNKRGQLLPYNTTFYNKVEDNESSTTTNSKNQAFLDTNTELVTQLNTLKDSDRITNSELGHLAEQTVFYISDIISELIDNPERLLQLFPEFGVKDGIPFSDKERQDFIDTMKSKSRIELVKFIGIQRLINNAKETLFTPTSIKMQRKATLIKSNFKAVIAKANPIFEQIEGFSLVPSGDVVEVQEIDESQLTDDETREFENIVETVGSLQEAWQVVFRTRDAISSMSTQIKTTLNRCFQLKLNKETNTIERVKDEWGLDMRLPIRETVSSIYSWTEGATSLSHMVRMLQKKSKENLWLLPIIERLTDTTGKESTFQSQFFGVFAKPFQSYSITIKENGVLKSIIVNKNPALKSAMEEVEVLYKTNVHPLFADGKVNINTLNTLTEISKELIDKSTTPLEELDREEIINLIYQACNCLGYETTPDNIHIILDSSTTLKTIANNLHNIVTNLTKAKDIEEYHPFEYKSPNNISGYLNKFLEPITKALEDTAINTVFDNGNMYQSRVNGSFLTTLLSKFHLEDPQFEEFLENEYGKYEWFKDKVNNRWRLSILEELSELSQADRKELFQHKVELSFNKHNYMRNLSEAEYALSIFSNYFSESSNSGESRRVAWYKMPMMSNKPSNEFLKMFRYTGATMRYSLINKFYDIFNQELMRIQTVELRNLSPDNPRYIANFDSNGKKFVMLDFLNDYLDGGSLRNTELGVLINKAIKVGTPSMTTDELSQLSTLAKKEIQRNIDNKVSYLLGGNITDVNGETSEVKGVWKENGILSAAKKVENIGSSDEAVRNSLEEFIWNDTYAAMQILELTITDPAFNKDAEDLQKRLAQLHAPGTKPNIEATWYNSKTKNVEKVSDGKFRTITLKDFDKFKSNIIENLTVVFDRKLAELEKKLGSKDNAQYKSVKAFYDGVLSQFEGINIADGQGYSSPTSYRKKAILFGKWGEQQELIYQKLLKGNYSHNDLKTAFQPIKPFVYGLAEVNSVDSDVQAPLSKLKVPTQFKNSEYLIILADAILRGENTGKPNFLRAIYDVMEESYSKDSTRGIDTIQFESACKTGNRASVDFNDLVDNPNGESIAKDRLERAIYKYNENPDGTSTKTDVYNTDSYVYELAFDNYCIQQEIPEHFKDHYQAHGSQIRYIIPSSLDTIDSEGNTVFYSYFDKGELQKKTAREFKKDYEKTISQNIDYSIELLSEELGLNNPNISKFAKRVAISKILTEEIKSSSRYNIDLLIACSINPSTGDFYVPLGDPIQSKRIEQLLNSIIKKRINKQEIAGGPVVQVANFGTSTELHIRFKNKNKDGEFLETKEEFEKNNPGKSYKEYVTNNQGGIAYFECFAPIYANELFQKFADDKGNIDIEAINRVNPELLKMIGYRIPTEEKFSCIPLKIVGFLPREAGEGIMLPNEITLLTGSDFDIDKLFLMRKEIYIAEKRTSKEGLTRDIINKLLQDYDIQKLVPLSADSKSIIEERVNAELEGKKEALLKRKQAANNNYLSIKDSYERLKNEKLRRNQSRYDNAADLIEEKLKSGAITQEEYTREMDSLDKTLDKGEKTIQEWFDNKISKLKEPSIELSETELNQINESKGSLIYDMALDYQKRILKDLINKVLEDPMSPTTNKLSQAIKNTYIDLLYKSVEETSGVTYRNNKIVDMTWAVLTNESTASKSLVPQGFDKEKLIGYRIAAYQNPSNKFTYEELVALGNEEVGILKNNRTKLVKKEELTEDQRKDYVTGIKALKLLCYTNKNLCFVDTQLQFYKQNSAAATAIGMAAVQKIAHSIIEDEGYILDISRVCDPYGEGPYGFTIAGNTFRGPTYIDSSVANDGSSITKTLGEFVGMFADAVKDPIANLMNINTTTMPLLSSLIRLKTSFEDVALFLSQPIIGKVLSSFHTKQLSEKIKLKDEIENFLKDFQKEFSLDNESTINNLQELSKEELISNLKDGNNTVTNYKVLKTLLDVISIAAAFRGPTFATRLNSMSDAVGPQIIDNLIKQYKIKNSDFSNFYKQDEEGNVGHADYFSIVNSHPILNSFYKALPIASEVFSEFPINSISFRNIMNIEDNKLVPILMSDRKILGPFADFYLSYLLMLSNAIPSKATPENKYQGLDYYINKFPYDFRNLKVKEEFKDNPFIQAIKYDFKNNKLFLKIDTVGMSEVDKEKLSDGWYDLYKSGERGKKLALHLFYYNFWRGGIAFNPKTFMSLLPIRLRDKIPGYNETFNVNSGTYAEGLNYDALLTNFAQNNVNNYNIVKEIKDISSLGKVSETKSGNILVISSKDKVNSYKKVPFITGVIDNTRVLFKLLPTAKDSETISYIEIPILGNNKEYLEISNDVTYKPIQTLNTTELASEDDELVVTDYTENGSIDSTDTETQTTLSKEDKSKVAVDTLLQEYGAPVSEDTQSESKVDKFSEGNEATLEDLNKQIGDTVKDTFKEAELELDEEKLLDDYNDIC